VLGRTTPAGAADGQAEASFVARINSIRQSHGIAPLAVYGELTGIARRWTDHMVANGNISHNGNLSGEVSANWTKLGENVGVGSNSETVMNAFVNSGPHYKNIVPTPSPPRRPRIPRECTQCLRHSARSPLR
jgi:uncharacterized protein YkwD